MQEFVNMSYEEQMEYFHTYGQDGIFDGDEDFDETEYERMRREDEEEDAEIDEMYQILDLDFECEIIWHVYNWDYHRDKVVEHGKMEFGTFGEFELFCERDGLVVPLSMKYDCYQSRLVHACFDPGSILGTDERMSILWGEENELKNSLAKIMQYQAKWGYEM